MIEHYLNKKDTIVKAVATIGGRNNPHPFLMVAPLKTYVVNKEGIAAWDPKSDILREVPLTYYLPKVWVRNHAGEEWQPAHYAGLTTSGPTAKPASQPKDI